jgi:hypothetical protein
LGVGASVCGWIYTKCSACFKFEVGSLIEKRARERGLSLDFDFRFMLNYEDVVEVRF